MQQLYAVCIIVHVEMLLLSIIRFVQNTIILVDLITLHVILLNRWMNRQIQERQIGIYPFRELPRLLPQHYVVTFLGIQYVHNMNTLKPQYEDSLSPYTSYYKSAIFHYHNGAYHCSIITSLSVYSSACNNECTMQFCGQC